MFTMIYQQSENAVKNNTCFRTIFFRREITNHIMVSSARAFPNIIVYSELQSFKCQIIQWCYHHHFSCLVFCFVSCRIRHHRGSGVSGPVYQGGLGTKYQGGPGYQWGPGYQGGPGDQGPLTDLAPPLCLVEIKGDGSPEGSVLNRSSRRDL